jgi:hypothetical protein
MIPRTNADFWKYFNSLLPDFQRIAREKFQLWKLDAFHPSLNFKLLFTNVWSVRVTSNFRPLGRRQGDCIVWFWIGSHDEYDALLKRLH